MRDRAMGYLCRIIPLNLPNLLTLVRICLVPLLVVLVALDSLLAAAAVFGVAAVTDIADGHLARSRNLITTFGRIADPVADKLLVGSALVSLVAVDRLALWIALVIVGRELGVTLLRYHAGTQGITIHVSSLGKLKTGTQMTAIPLLMLVPDPTGAWVSLVMLVVVGITIASGLDYALAYERESSAANAALPVAR